LPPDGRCFGTMFGEGPNGLTVGCNTGCCNRRAAQRACGQCDFTCVPTRWLATSVVFRQPHNQAVGYGYRWRLVNSHNTPTSSHALQFLVMASILHHTQVTEQSGCGMQRLAQPWEPAQSAPCALVYCVLPDGIIIACGSDRATTIWKVTTAELIKEFMNLTLQPTP